MTQAPAVGGQRKGSSGMSGRNPGCVDNPNWVTIDVACHLSGCWFPHLQNLGTIWATWSQNFLNHRNSYLSKILIENPNILPGMMKRVRPRHHGLPLCPPPQNTHTHDSLERGFHGPSKIQCSVIQCHMHMAQSFQTVRLNHMKLLSFDNFWLAEMTFSYFSLRVSFVTVVTCAHAGTKLSKLSPSSSSLCDIGQDTSPFL